MAQSPRRSQGRDTTILREILGEAAGRIEEILEDQPAVAGRIYSMVATSYGTIGEFDTAMELHHKAIPLVQGAYGRESGPSAIALTRLAYVLREQSKLQEAEKILREAVEIWSNLDAYNPRHFAESLEDLATTVALTGRHQEAEALMNRSLNIRKELGDKAQTLVARGYHHLGFILAGMDRHRDAEASYRRAFEIFKSERGDDHPDTIVSLAGVGVQLTKLGDFLEAEKVLRRVTENTARFFGEDSLDTAVARSNLAWCLLRQERHEEAASLYMASLAAFRSKLPEHDGRVASALRGLDECRRMQEKDPAPETLVGRFEFLLKTGQVGGGPPNPREARGRSEVL